MAEKNRNLQLFGHFSSFRRWILSRSSLRCVLTFLHSCNRWLTVGRFVGHWIACSRRIKVIRIFRFQLAHVFIAIVAERQRSTSQTAVFHLFQRSDYFGAGQARIVKEEKLMKLKKMCHNQSWVDWSLMSCRTFFFQQFVFSFKTVDVSLMIHVFGSHHAYVFGRLL